MVDLPHLRTEIRISAERLQYITNSPAQYAREVGFHLQRTPLNHEILFELHHFMLGYDYEVERGQIPRSTLMCTFLAQDLASHLTKFAFSDDFWHLGDASNTASNGLEVNDIPMLILPVFAK